VHGHVIRPYSHSLSDDERLYRPESEIKKDLERDPIASFQKFLLAEGICDAAALQKIRREVDAVVQSAVDAALDAPFPEPSSYALHVYSEALKPSAQSFDSSPAEGPDRGSDRTMADTINTCLRDEMRRDERIVIFGEDVADCSNDEYLQDKSLKGKGGVFKLTSGLQREFGSGRVFNSPLAEANIVGRALGMAARGLKPVVEIQFFDYIWTAMHQLRNEVPLIRWRSNNLFNCPLVIRVAIGGYLNGGAIYHSQCGESMFTHTPGMHVVFASNALDAAGLLRTAIRCDDPVLFLEHKRLYREPFGRAPYPGPDYTIPFGKARIWKEGRDVTVVTYGATLPRSLLAAQRLEREHGISVEVLDLRTLNPYDFEAIAASVRKTSRVLIVHEDMLSWGYGAEIAARIGSELFHDLDAPVQRLAAKDTFVAYQPLLEDAILPQADDIFAAIQALCAH
jgi:2-oxoisovalerate dehydrogenase E1 component